MYRKLSVFLFLVSLLCPAVFASSQEALTKALEQAAVSQKPLPMQHSANAHNKGVIPIKGTVDAYVNSAYADNSPLVKDCQAVRISSHYLLASMACVGLSERGIIYHYAGAGSAPQKTTPKVTRTIEQVRINGEVVDADHIIASKENKVFLIRIDPNNENLRKTIQNKPAVNLFIAKDPQTMKTIFSSVQVNRERLCLPSRVCAEVEITDVCTESGCFRLGWKLIRGDSGDPVFGLIPQLSTEEFLLGFNAADVVIDQRKAGRNYYFFPSEMAQFLQENIEKDSAEDWAQIKRKMVNEDYFLNR